MKKKKPLLTVYVLLFFIMGAILGFHGDEFTDSFAVISATLFSLLLIFSGKHQKMSESLSSIAFFYLGYEFVKMSVRYASMN